MDGNRSVPRARPAGIGQRSARPSLAGEILASAGLVLAFMALPARAQSPSVELSESIDVEVVNLEVVVTDRSGAPVAGLTREDFEVREGGQPVELVNFAEVTSESEGTSANGASSGWAAPDWAEGPEAGSQPLYLAFFVDQVHLAGGHGKRFLEQIWPVIERDLAPRDRVAILGYDGNLHVLLPFTSDRSRITAALSGLGKEVSLRVRTEQSERSAIADIRDRQRDAMRRYDREFSEQVQQRSDQFRDSKMIFEHPCPADLGILARNHASEAYAVSASAVMTLRSVADSMAGLPGRKALVHVSDGIPLVPGAAAFEFAISLCDGSGARAGMEDGFDVNAITVELRSTLFDPTSARMDMQDFSLDDLLRGVTAHATAVGVRIYTFQASGLGEAGTPASAGMSRNLPASARESLRRGEQDSLAFLASETGGRALLDSNGFERGIEQAIHDLESYYLLGYRPPPGRAGERHPIQVKVSRPGVRVLHPAAREIRTAGQRVADRMRTAILHRVGDNPLSVTGATSVQQGKRVLRLSLPLRSVTLLPQPEGLTGLLTVFLSSPGPAGSDSIRSKKFGVRLPEDRLEALRDEPYELGIMLPPELGNDDVVVAVRDDLADTVSVLIVE